MMIAVVTMLVNLFFGTPHLQEDDHGWDCRFDPQTRTSMTCEL